MAVGDANGKAAELIGGSHHFLGMRSCAQKRKISSYNEFGIGDHLRSHAKKLTQIVHARTSAPRRFRARRGLLGKARSGDRRCPRRGNNRASVQSIGARCDYATIHWRGVPDLGRSQSHKSRRASENAAAARRERAPRLQSAPPAATTEAGAASLRPALLWRLF